jgi:hypothetical protein
MAKQLLLFAVIYTSISFYLLNEIPKGEHGNLLFIPVLFFFWIIAAFLLTAMYKVGKKKNKAHLNIPLLVFCTPLPILVYALGWYIWTSNFEFKTAQKVYGKNGYIIKEVSYLYKKKKEYWSNFDSPNNEYRLDSVVYFNEKEKKYQTEIYEGTGRLKGDLEQAKLPAKDQ